MKGEIPEKKEPTTDDIMKRLDDVITDKEEE